ncbi:MAG: hypothetical protein H3C47_08265, partial [Candidatus Cloacimonetes bacterium]|nr:hypothetical protein [Candidatus Cloacimonadota bacterium]
MTWATYQQFTLFVLLVCIVLSFVLRQLIREVQELRQLMHKDLHQFAEKLVLENPSIENYLQLGSLYFRNRDYVSAHRYFEKLLSEKVYAKEAGYYMTLCLIEEGQRQQAWAMFQRLDQSRYTDWEKRRLLIALRTPRFFGIVRNFFLKILLTQVSLKYPLLGETYTSAREQKIAKLMASMPTRYRKMEWLREGETDWDFQALDIHLDRKVLLRILKPGQESKDIEKFFEHPRILAQLHSRAFPQVYDLQQGELCYYSLELPVGLGLIQKISEYGSDNRPDDFLRCFLSLCRPLLHLKTGGFWLSEFEPSAILWHSQRDSFCFHTRLECFDNEKSSEVMKSIVDLFQNKAQMPKIELCDLEDFVQNLQAGLEDCLLERAQDRQSLLEELLELEVLHRASVHGLKGKFG